SGNCVDEAPGCNLSGGVICQSKNLESFARQYCKKTCGYCSDSTVAPGTVGTGCGSNPNCASWIRNGFCNSTFYSQAYKMQYCGRACGLC
ncbi:shTK domain protein, partial [Ostertagia ostertagi]